jgi:hypothetical protein
MIGYVLVVWILPIFGVLILASALWSRIEHSPAAVDQTSVMIFCLWLIVAFPLVRWLRLRSGYRNLFPRGTPRIARLTANEDQVISAIPDRSEGRFYWKTIQDSAEDKSGMILFVRKKQFLVVPRHALNEAQWVELRQLIAAKSQKLQT